MYSEVTWALVSSRTQVWPQIIIDSNHSLDYPFLMIMVQEGYFSENRNSVLREYKEEIMEIMKRGI